MAGVLTRKGYYDTDIHRGKKVRGQREKMANLQAKERSHRMTSLPADTLILDFWPPES